MADPGTKESAFAVNFIVLDRYKPKIYWIDEIYEIVPEQKVVGKIAPKILEKINEFNPDLRQWYFFYDPAAAAFNQEIIDRFPQLPFQPAKKRQGEKEDEIGKLIEIFEARIGVVSSRCVNTIWEFDNYYRDKLGRYIKKNDHAIDNSRYFLTMSGFDMKAKDDDERSNPPIRKKSRRYYSLEEDLRNMRSKSYKHAVLKRYGEYD